MYKIAIPSYKRALILKNKTLSTLGKSNVSASRIYIFVANMEEQREYESVIPRESYNRIVVGKLGIANQRIFIRNFFNEGEHIVSMDDDIEEISKVRGNGFVAVANLNKFFEDAFKELKKHKLYIWGVYPVRNAFFMKNRNKPISSELKFLIGVLHGYIVRHDKSLDPSVKSEGKEDYEQSILYYKKDGGVLRFNNIATKTKFLAKGGLGEEGERFEINRKAAMYLHETYPDLVTRFQRKNGMSEVRLNDRTKKKTRKQKKRSKGTLKKH